MGCMSECPSCENNVWRSVFLADDMYAGTPYPIVSCVGCGLTRTTLENRCAPDAGYVYGGSADAGRRFGPMQSVLRYFRQARVARVAAGQCGRALDVGCGDGAFLEELAGKGWDVIGTELSESIARTARARLGDRVCVGNIQELRMSSASFDLITLWHVLEHLEDPKRVLEESRRLLKADGKIIVAVPNIESWQARLFGRDWLHLDVPRHRWHFSARTLGGLAEGCGLWVERIRHFSLEYGPIAFIQGIATKVGLGHSLFTRLMRQSPQRLLQEPLFWAHVPVVGIMALPSLFCELTAAACHRGGAIEVVLRKR